MWVRGNKPELAATKVPSAIDIAWSAGIYEGEGTCRLCGAGAGKRGFMASVVQKQPELLYKLRDWFGGNVRKLARNNECYIWDICGDQARIFIALIYGFMTARRKAQIDATRVLYFLGSASPVGLNTAQLLTAMEVYYEQERRTKAENATAYRLNKYKNDSADPEWSKKTNEYNANLRANWTEEQREAARQYQRDYYQNKKKKLSNVVEIKKTA